jgi:chromosome segregation ATPase
VRILRLRLRDYRGIREREVHFAPRGITLVAGPNEVGKSSLAEAIDLVFDELDSTTKQRVRNVQPVDRDAGAEIEIEVETGPYAFTCSKRFHHRPATQLLVTRPRREHHSGREAHQRMREILDETLDTQLWRALRVQQGQGLEQASWLGQPTLAAALDRAAGAIDPGGARDESLYEAVGAERARYFTPGGRLRRELGSSQREAERARQDADARATALAALEQDVQRSAALREQLVEQESAAHRAEAELRQQEQRFQTVSTLRDALRTAEARRDAACAEEREALQVARQRSQLVTAHAAAEADLAQRSEEVESAEPALLAARAELEHAERAATQQRNALDAAARRDARRHAELELRRAQRDLEELSALGAEIDAAERAVQEARAELLQRPVDEGQVRQVRDAELEVERAQARVDAEGPLVQLRAAQPLELHVDGRRETVEAGALLERRLAESLQLSLPDALDLTVVAGAGAAERLKLLEERRTRWRSLCAEVGVAGHADAVAALAAQRDGERRLAERERALAELRDGRDDAALAARHAHLAEQVERLAARCDPQLTLTAEAPAADAATDEASEDLERTRRHWEEAERRRDALSLRYRELAERHHDTVVRLELATQSFGDVESRLLAARAEQSDEVLALARDGRGARARELESEAREGARRLAECEPEAAEAALAAARARREACARALAALRDESLQLATRLELRGEAGLYEQWERAAAEAERLAREDAALQRRARAAATLYDALEDERVRARRHYADPLKARIEALGRPVFGADFEVELDDELRVARRIQAGVALDFEQLSAGAREQISLLARLACASLVGDDEGAPLVLDDALGHSDPERLTRLGRTLELAAPDCQILVLTCTPERYQSVAGAKLVQLA